MTSILTRRGVIAGTAAMAAATLSTHAQQSRPIRIGSIAVTGSPWHIAMNKFRDAVHDGGHGAVTVAVYVDGQLGDVGDMMAALQDGSLDMAYLPAGAATSLQGGEILNILYVPYLFSSVPSCETICNGADFLTIYDQVAKATGVRTICAWGRRSPRALQTIHGPITDPGQVRGLRMRIPATETVKSAFEALGAQLVPLGTLDIYTALRRGMIDGQDNGFDLAIPGRYYEAAKFWSATDHVYELVAWFISEKLWQSLTSDERTLLAESAKQGGQVTTDLTRTLNQDALDVLKHNDCSYTIPDRGAFRSAVANSHRAFDGVFWPKGMVEHIRRVSFA